MDYKYTVAIEDADLCGVPAMMGATVDGMCVLHFEDGSSLEVSCERVLSLQHGEPYREASK